MTTPDPRTIPDNDDTRSAYVIVFAFFMLYGFILGLGLGWWIWG